MNIVPYESIHLKEISLQPAQQYLAAYVDDDMMIALESEYAFSGLVDGMPVICAGIIPIWHNRALAWAYLSADAGAHMTAITKAIKRFFELAPFERIEATVDSEFAKAHRWIQMLGFNIEADRMIKYRPDGGDSALYARIK